MCTKLCLTLCDPMKLGLPGLSVHGIFQARILDWVVMPSSRGYSWPRDWTQVSCTAGRPFTAEPSGKPNIILLLLRGEKTEIVWVKVTHSCLTLCDPMENSPGRILKWVAYPFSTRSSWPRNWTGVPCIAGIFFTNWAIREACYHLYVESKEKKDTNKPIDKSWKQTHAYQGGRRWG